MNLLLKSASTSEYRGKRTYTWAGRLVVTLVALFIVLTGCANGEEADAAQAEQDGDVQYAMGEPIEDSTYAAIVTSDYGSDTLTTEEFYAQIQMVEAQFPQIRDDDDQREELRRSIVEDFVLRHAVYGEADRLNLQVDTARIEQQIQMYRQQAGNEETFQQMLAANNMTEDSLRSSVRDYLRQQMVLEHMAETAAEPTEPQIQAFQDERAQQVRARHILFLTQNTPADEEEQIRQRAQAVLDSIKTGADFEAMARRHSQDGTAAAGGDLGFFSRGQMVEPFEEATFALQDSGDVTQDLVETQYGYHIIQLTGRRTGTPMDTTQARGMLMQQRRQEAVEAGIDELRGKVVVRVNPTVVDADLNARPENF